MLISSSSSVMQKDKRRERCCLVTRETQSPEMMIRFVLSPNGEIVPDLTERLPGRGMWLKADKNVLNTALQRNMFSRSAKCRVAVPKGLNLIIKKGLTQKITETLCLARRAGQITYGFVKVREEIFNHRVGLIIQAMDGSSEERKRLLSGIQEISVVSVLSAEALGAVFNRERVVHAAMLPGQLAWRVCWDSKRLTGFID